MTANIDTVDELDLSEQELAERLDEIHGTHAYTVVQGVQINYSWGSNNVMPDEVTPDDYFVDRVDFNRETVTVRHETYR